MRNATLLLVIKEDKILLGMKKRGFGEGKWNGFGGKVNTDESIEEAAAREMEEEAGIIIDKNKMEKCAELNFTFPFVPKEKAFDQLVHVFVVKEWEGEPKESEEMLPKWFLKNELPYESMWNDDAIWLPKILNGEKLKADFVFDKDNETIAKHTLSEF
ncbi:MAG: NUDIX domain-containing protein [Candidatus Diapherotrites archaeon]|jgi:8-oxo-dGTP pyrophosphatase MutT (NUDIX family)|uniref:Oxidized purine nucleoside triphosphate hydrolase n=1 Tax=Candidatus Iainarchaeum sp. TaxID=3101447 RepID=A0A8T5GGL4_9ARCH|nr:NUDIX domain-containing protein [Candidatus Diapherotrites archaeon]MBT7241037.1 NUDIX domain-containing protein [Candidatus Diapherotrites archaeon]